MCAGTLKKDILIVYSKSLYQNYRNAFKRCHSGLSGILLTAGKDSGQAGMTNSFCRYFYFKR